MSGEARLSARGLTYSYRERGAAVEGVDFDVRDGELLAVVGPNGAGKSTLLKLLAGLVEPDAGQVELDGRRLGDFTLRERARRMALVPQSLRALPDTRVFQFVAGGRYAHLGAWRRVGPEDYAAVGRALAQCDLGGFETRALAELSGGELQRVLLARALAQEARVLLVDEPTNSLDPEHQVRVFALLRTLVRAGRAAVVVTHDLSLAGQFASGIQLLDRGRIVHAGAPEQVLCRACLEPVYGPHLFYGRGPGAEGRPFVLPWLDVE